MKPLFALIFCIALGTPVVAQEAGARAKKTDTGFAGQWSLSESDLDLSPEPEKPLWPFAESIVDQVFAQTRESLASSFSSQERRHWEEKEPKVFVFGGISFLR